MIIPMRTRRLISVIVLIPVIIALIGCGEKNYDAGMYWLEKENKPTMAARSFLRSLEDRPGHWKTNKMALQALSQAEDVPGFEKQLLSTLQYFPDSSRSEAIQQPGVSLLGEERYNQLSAPIAEQHYGNLIAKKGNKPELLCNIIMASCRARDTVAAVDYFKRLLDAGPSGIAPDTIVQELGFLVGSAQVEWVQLDWKVTRHPDDIAARLAQLETGILVGDSIQTRIRLSELMTRLPDTTGMADLAKRYARLVGVDPFNTARIMDGWEGSFSRDGKSIVYIKERGKPNEPDPYIYLASANGTGERPILKGNQQALPSIAWPALSPDNRWVYFYATSNRGWTPERSVGRFHLYRVSPQYGAKPQKLTDADLLPVSPHFNPDGSLVLVKRDVGSTRSSVEVARLDPDTRKIETLSRIGEPVSGGTFTPAGDSLVFTTDRGIFRRSIKGGNITVDLARRGLFFPMISPDGKKLLVYNRQNQALLIDRRDGTLTFIGRTAIPYGSFNTTGNLMLTQAVGGKRWLVKLDLAREIDITDKFLAVFKVKH